MLSLIKISWSRQGIASELRSQHTLLSDSLTLAMFGLAICTLEKSGYI